MGITCQFPFTIQYRRSRAYKGPAKYGASGIMTFIVNQEGKIYEKDLGKDMANKAAAMTTFDPDSTWKKYEEDTGQ
jgi:hypothetical protein